MVQTVVETLHNFSIAWHALYHEPTRYDLCQLLDLTDALLLVNKLAFRLPLVQLL